jgi:RNA ligase
MQYWHTIAKHFKGNKNFIVVDKDEYFVVNYVRAGDDTHPTVTSKRETVLREGRGLIFCSKTGELLSRPFHKFFNLNVRSDVTPDFTKPHHIITKLDGSMVRPFRVGNNIRWGTKMGVTDVSMQAEEYVAKNPRYEHMAAEFLAQNMTPIFEWCSRQQRIVLDYPGDRLVLLAIRDNWTGSYISREQLELAASYYNVPVVDVHTLEWSTSDMPAFTEFVRSMKGVEGFIIQFDDGHMIKIKCDEYVALHKAKSYLDNERDVVGMILDEKVDDLLPLLPETDRKRLLNFQDQIWFDILKFQTSVNVVLKMAEKIPRKDFAMSSANMDPILRASVFKFYDIGSCDLAYIKDTVKRNLGSKSSFEKMESILKTANWKEEENA